MSDRKALMALSWKIQRRDQCTRAQAMRRAWSWVKRKHAERLALAPLTAARLALSDAAGVIHKARRNRLPETDAMHEAVKAANAEVARIEAAIAAGQKKPDACKLSRAQQAQGLKSPTCECVGCRGGLLDYRQRNAKNYAASHGGW